MKNMKKILSISVLLAAVCLMLVNPTDAKAQDAQTIAEGVYIGSIYVGGMTEEEALAAIDAYVEAAGQAVFTLSAGEKSIEVTAGELGVYFSDTNVVKEALDVGRSGSIFKRFKAQKVLELG